VKDSTSCALERVIC